MARFRKIKKIVFLTGTRADFGKIKSLIKASNRESKFKAYVFATGMHLNPKYGRTVDEIYNSKIVNVHEFTNHSLNNGMDQILAKTISGFSFYVKKINPDLIILHGDRPETLAGAIVGSFNNILVAHIEGGEVSGTIDELIRHSVSKLAHVHLVSNKKAKQRLIQLGEKKSSIYILGSPDIDLLKSNKLPSLINTKKHYDIPFNSYSTVLYHPVTTEQSHTKKHISNLIKSLIKSKKNYIVIYPNNDYGSEIIISEYRKLKSIKNFKVFPSLRFEYFLTVLKNSNFIIGNSSSGIIEAPYYNIPTINIGTRQNNRLNYDRIFNCSNHHLDILKKINAVSKIKKSKSKPKFFGEGNSSKYFIKILKSRKIWNIKLQKYFQDVN